MSLLEDAKAGRPLMGPGGGPAGTSAATGSLSLSPPPAPLPSSEPPAHPPYPRRSDRPMSPKSPLRRQGSSGLSSHLGSPVRGPGAQAGAGQEQLRSHSPGTPHSSPTTPPLTSPNPKCAVRCGPDSSPPASPLVPFRWHPRLRMRPLLTDFCSQCPPQQPPPQ